jgi:23S rRNA pseudouridine1911/1915/1917 synthase
MEEGMTYQFVVTGTERTSVKQFLFRHLPAFSRFALRQAAASGACRVDGESVPASYRLRAGQVVEFSLDPEPQRTILAEELPLDILYEDDSLAVVNKPAGMLVHPTARERHGTVANALLGHWRGENRRPTFPHRLDRDTSGVLVVAKDAAAATSLALQFENRQVHKTYVALVAGLVAEPREIDAPIGRVGGETPPWQVRPEGRPSLSRLTPVEWQGTATLVNLEPVTGRTNQLRIHCASIGHPILGDRLYGGPPAPRLCLHASQLEFRHPATGREMTVEASRVYFNVQLK